MTSLSAIVTNSVNAVVVAIATAVVGGIFSSTATDMGTQVRNFIYFYKTEIPNVLFLDTREYWIDIDRFNPNSYLPKLNRYMRARS